VTKGTKGAKAGYLKKEMKKIGNDCYLFKIRSKHTNDSEEHLFIMTDNTMQIFRQIQKQNNNNKLLPTSTEHSNNEKR